MANITWLCEIDWDGDGTHEADEAARLNYVKIQRGRKRFIRRDGQGFERQRVGELVMTLDNHDRRFDPLYASSPLYPDVTPGKDVRLRAIDSSGTTQNVFRGRIDNIWPSGTPIDNKVKIRVEDGWRWLFSEDVASAVVQGQAVSSSIDSLLDNADWPSAWGRNLGASTDDTDYWWGSGESAASQIADLVESEQGQFWLDAAGQARFRGRHAVYGVAAVDTIYQTQALKTIGLPQPWEAVRNDIKVKVWLPTLESATRKTLYNAPNIPLVRPGETYTVWIEYAFNDIPVAADNPILLFDANTREDDTGTDIESDFSSNLDDFGVRAKVEITNDGNIDGYLTDLRVRGYPLYWTEAIQVAEDTAGQAIYGPRSLTIDFRWQQDEYIAQDLAHYLKNLLTDPLAFPIVPLEYRDTKQLGLDLFDKVNLVFGDIGINASYFIGGLELEWLSDTGEAFRTLYRCEPVDPQTYWIFPVKMGEESYLAY